MEIWIIAIIINQFSECFQHNRCMNSRFNRIIDEITVSISIFGNIQEI